jgi:S1-C subfamily serine protease
MDDYSDYDRPRQGPSIWPLLLLVVLLAAVVWRFWPWEHGSGLNPNATPRAVTARGDLAEDEKATIDLYKNTAPSVVHVTRIAEGVDYSGNDIQVQSGLGSGFVWDKEGHIVTNNHVVQGADALQVVLADHSKWTGQVVGTDARADVAVLKVDAPASRLQPILIGSSHDLLVGQKAFAIGNPFGLDQTLTTGIISALDRDVPAGNDRTIKGAIQTNAAINPGNSGGPLLDSAGRLIGITTAIYSPSGASAGVGFAIPVDTVNHTVTQLIRHGKIPRPGLGIMPASDQISETFGVDDGVLIMQIIPGSPAAKAGLRPVRQIKGQYYRRGDIIMGIDGKPVHNMRDLFSALEPHKVGDQVKVKVRRDNDEIDVPVTLDALPTIAP